MSRDVPTRPNAAPIRQGKNRPCRGGVGLDCRKRHSAIGSGPEKPALFRQSRWGSRGGNLLDAHQNGQSLWVGPQPLSALSFRARPPCGNGRGLAPAAPSKRHGVCFRYAAPWVPHPQGGYAVLSMAKDFASVWMTADSGFAFIRPTVDDGGFRFASSALRS